MTIAMLVLAHLGCVAPKRASCVERYDGRQLLSPDFEEARASLKGLLADVPDQLSDRVGVLAPGWGVHLAIRDEPIAEDYFWALTTRIDACKSVEIQLAAGELAFGSMDATRASLAHEYVHAVMVTRLPRSVWSSEPLWMMEGLAVWGSREFEPYARKILGNRAYRPRDIPLLQQWSPPAVGEKYREIDYFMSGVLLSAALGEGGSADAFVTELDRGLGSSEALSSVAGRPWDQLLAEAGRRGQELLDAKRAAMEFDAISDAMIAEDRVQLEAIARHSTSPLAPLALSSLQKLVCRDAPLDECRTTTTFLREHAHRIAASATARAQLHLARAHLRVGQGRECTAVGSVALRRAAGVFSADEIVSSLELLAECAVAAGDVAGLTHTADLGLTLLRRAPDHREHLVERIAAIAAEAGHEKARGHILALPRTDRTPWDDDGFRRL